MESPHRSLDFPRPNEGINHSPDALFATLGVPKDSPGYIQKIRDRRAHIMALCEECIKELDGVNDRDIRRALLGYIRRHIMPKIEWITEEKWNESESESDQAMAFYELILHFRRAKTTATKAPSAILAPRALLFSQTEAPPTAQSATMPPVRISTISRSMPSATPLLAKAIAFSVRGDGEYGEPYEGTFSSITHNLDFDLHQQALDQIHWDRLMDMIQAEAVLAGAEFEQDQELVPDLERYSRNTLGSLSHDPGEDLSVPGTVWDLNLKIRSVASFHQQIPRLAGLHRGIHLRIQDRRSKHDPEEDIKKAIMYSRNPVKRIYDDEPLPKQSPLKLQKIDHKNMSSDRESSAHDQGVANFLQNGESSAPLPDAETKELQSKDSLVTDVQNCFVAQRASSNNNCFKEPSAILNSYSNSADNYAVLRTDSGLDVEQQGPKGDMIPYIALDSDESDNDPEVQKVLFESKRYISYRSTKFNDTYVAPSRESSSLQSGSGSRPSSESIVSSKEHNPACTPSQEPVYDENEELDIEQILTSKIYDGIQQLNRDEINRFFRHNRFMKRGPHTTVDWLVPGLTLRLKTVQVIGLWFMFHRIKDTGGAIIADQMGTGKTIMNIAFIQYKLLLIRNRLTVEDYRTRGIPLHLPRSNKNPELRCPSQLDDAPDSVTKRLPFSCSCEYGSAASQFRLSPGVNYVLCKPALIDNWVKQFTQVIDIVPLPRSGKKGTTARKDLKYISKDLYVNSDKKSGKIPVVNMYNRYVSEMENPREVTILMRSDPDSLTDGEQLTIASTIVLCTPGVLFERWVAPIFLNRSRKEEKTVRDVPVHWVAVVIQDEGHEFVSAPVTAQAFWGKGAQTSQHLLGHCPRTIVCSLFFNSGTPFEQSPYQFAPYWKFHWEEWRVRPENCASVLFTGGFDLAKLKEIDNGIETCVKSNVKSHEYDHDLLAKAHEWSQQLLTAMMIKRTHDSTWFGKRLLEMPKMIKVEKRAIYEGSVLKKLNDHANRVVKQILKDSNGKACGKMEGNRMYLDRLAASWPYTIDIKNEHGEDAVFTEKAVTSGDFDPRMTRPLSFGPHLENLFKSSAKLPVLKDIIRNLDPGNAMREPEKLVISGFAPFTVMLLLEWLRKEGLKAAYVHTSLGPSRNIKIIEIFNQNTPSNEIAKDDTYIRILVSTTGYLKSGLNLHKSTRLVLFEPEFLSVNEEQVAYRVCRTGQSNAESFIYKIMTNTVVEKRISSTKNARSFFKEHIIDEDKDVNEGKDSELGKESAANAVINISDDDDT